jgi:hypothetical protein
MLIFFGDEGFAVIIIIARNPFMNFRTEEVVCVVKKKS